MGTVSTWLLLGAVLQTGPFVVSPLPEAEDPVLALRAADRVALHLDRLGAPVFLDRAWAREASDLPVVHVDGRRDGEEGLVLSARIPGSASEPLERRGRLRDMDRLCVQLALESRAVQGETYLAQAEDLLTENMPWKVHELLGKGHRMELDGKLLQASLLYDRAARVGDRVWLEALEFRARVRRAQSAERRRQDQELAQGAAVRAGVAARNGDRNTARDGWRSFLKYTAHRGQAYSVPLVPRRPKVQTRTHWWFDTEELRVSLPFRLPIATMSREGELWAAGPNYVLLRQDAALRRQDVEAGRFEGRRWSRVLSFEPLGVHVSGGFVGAWGVDKLVWLDPALGSVTDVVDAQVLAAGDRGLVVQQEEAYGLLRAGQTSRAWSRPGQPGTTVQALATDERIVVAENGVLRVLKSHNGLPVDFEARGRWIHADGRFGTFEADGEVGVVDLLAGRQVARIRGPGRPVSGATRSYGVAVGFDTGDLVWVSSEGDPFKRASFFGPITSLDGSLPDELLLTTPSGLVAMDDSAPGEATAAHGALELARAALEDDDREGALAFANCAARRGVQNVAEAERLRAELLPVGPARDYAQDRARSAERLEQPLLPFRLAGPPALSEVRTSSTASSGSPRRR